MSNIAVSLQNISFSYDKALVLKNVSVDIEEHQICFIMGNNGSGKTTLLKNVLGFLTPIHGKILIDSREVTSMDHGSLSKLVSYVPQAIQLNTDFKVIDYLSLGRTPHIGLLNRLSEADYDIIDKYSSKFGIEECFGTEFNKLSGGQKQMVAIVRSLIQDTPIIVMDEPMSALDIGKQVDLLKAFRELVHEGKTIIMTTHNPNHALAVKSNVCFMKQGEITAYGRNNVVINEEIIQAIYGSNVILNHGQYESIVFDVGEY